MMHYGTSYAAFCPIHWPELEDCDTSCNAARHELRLVGQLLYEYWKHATCLDCGASIKSKAQRCNSCEMYRRNRRRKSVAA